MNVYWIGPKVHLHFSPASFDKKSSRLARLSDETFTLNRHIVKMSEESFSVQVRRLAFIYFIFLITLKIYFKFLGSIERRKYHSRGTQECSIRKFPAPGVYQTESWLPKWRLVPGFHNWINRNRYHWINIRY